MKNLFTILITTFLGLAALSSCNKSNTPEPAAETKFTWHYDGTTFVAKQHTARLRGIGGPEIIAGRQEGISAGSGPRINLTSFNQGTYTVASGSGNLFHYVDVSGTIHNGTTGTITITKNASNHLGGNFSMTLTNNKSITGNFTNIPFQP